MAIQTSIWQGGGGDDTCGEVSVSAKQFVLQQKFGVCDSSGIKSMCHTLSDCHLLLWFVTVKPTPWRCMSSIASAWIGPRQELVPCGFLVNLMWIFHWHQCCCRKRSMDLFMLLCDLAQGLFLVCGNVGRCPVPSSSDMLSEKCFGRIFISKIMSQFSWHLVWHVCVIWLRHSTENWHSLYLQGSWVLTSQLFHCIRCKCSEIALIRSLYLYWWIMCITRLVKVKFYAFQ